MHIAGISSAKWKEYSTCLTGWMWDWNDIMWKTTELYEQIFLFIFAAFKLSFFPLLKKNCTFLMVTEEVMIGPREPSELVQLTQLVWDQKLGKLESSGPNSTATWNIGSESPCNRKKSWGRIQFFSTPVRIKQIYKVSL